MIYYQISQIVFIIFLALSIYFTLRKNYQALLALFVTGIGLGGFNVYYGTLWLPYKIVSIFIIIVVLFNSKKNIYPKYFRKLTVLFIISIIIALIFQPSDEQRYLPYFQKSNIRPFVQLFSYISIAALIPFCMLTLRNEKDFSLFIKRYFLIVELVILFAVLQFILQKLNIEFMPILRPNVTDSPTAAFSFQNFKIVRLYGITGEPKTLSAFIFPYFFSSLYYFYNKQYNRNYSYHVIMLLISLFVIINAFSSAVLISLAVTLILTSLIWFRSKIKIILPIAIIIFALQYFNPGQFILTVGSTTSPYTLYDLIIERTSGRIAKEGNERSDFLGLSYMVEGRQYRIFTGIGMGMYPYYAKSGGWHGIDPIDSNWVVFLMDFGLLGVILFLYILIKLLNLKSKKIFKQDKLFNFALIGLFASYLLGLGVFSYPYMMLFLGLTLVTWSFIRRQFNNNINNV